METRGHRHPEPARENPKTYTIDSRGQIERRYAKRDKAISARQWRKLRSAARRAAKAVA